MLYFVYISFCLYMPHLLCFDSSRGRWYNISISFLDGEIEVPCPTQGVICIINTVEDVSQEDCKLFVTNPLTKRVKVLSAFKCGRFTPMVAPRLEFH